MVYSNRFIGSDSGTSANYRLKLKWAAIDFKRLDEGIPPELVEEKLTGMVL